jgi:hypothetical protein
MITLILNPDHTEVRSGIDIIEARGSSLQDIAQAVIDYEFVSFESEGDLTPERKALVEKAQGYDPSWIRVWARHVLAGGDSNSFLSMF